MKIKDKFESDFWSENSCFHDANLDLFALDLSSKSLRVEIAFEPDDESSIEEIETQSAVYRFLGVTNFESHSQRDRSYQVSNYLFPRNSQIDSFTVSDGDNESTTFLLKGIYGWYLRFCAADFELGVRAKL